MSSDLSFARIYISVIGNSVERRQVFVWLCENVGQIRFSLAKRLKHMRRIPNIYFKLSDTTEKANLLAIIDELSPKQDEDINIDDFEFDELSDDDDDDDDDIDEDDDE
jgi:ribosome-binding factor A